MVSFFFDPIIGKSKYDFRNPKAKDLENWFKPWYGKPAASVNRVPTSDVTEPYANSNPDLWQAEVEKELVKDHQLNIILKSDYNEASRVLELDMAAIPLVNLSGNYNISIYLIESKIIDAQTNGANIDLNYTHNHVLRDMITKFDGDAFGTDLKKGDIINRNYAYTLPTTPEGLWNPKNMKVVVMISHQGSNDKSVVQAAEVHVLE
ncbi:MAG: Omp28-related outer membrane protein [Saprospiraceae bacterium]|nr:Omp28-related outer membrane protein [Saprospiraceae bacterium]